MHATASLWENAPSAENDCIKLPSATKQSHTDMKFESRRVRYKQTLMGIPRVDTPAAQSLTQTQ